MTVKLKCLSCGRRMAKDSIERKGALRAVIFKCDDCVLCFLTEAGVPNFDKIYEAMVAREQ